jgi:SNF2-related domain/Helicase conserved C-terminal domain
MSGSRLPTLANLAWLRSSSSYIDSYNAEQKRQGRDRHLLPEPTFRQMRTALEILRRLKRAKRRTGGFDVGQRGVLLADDVGLGKTGAAAFVAGIYAGSGFRVRVLAPNAPMARKWLDELRSHQTILGSYGYAYVVSDRVRKLRERRISVSTHWRSVNSGRLACDLLVIDEAHRAKNDSSLFAKELRRQRNAIGKVLILTATPFSIAPAELGRMLDLVGAKLALTLAVNKAATALETLWKGKFSDLGFAAELASACSSAIDAIQPYVIRHGVATLPTKERRLFGATHIPALESDAATASQMEILMRADRALELGKRTGAWRMARTNDPRFHVGWSQLRRSLDIVSHEVEPTHPDNEFLRLHCRRIRVLLGKEGDHPKMISTGNEVIRIARANERVVLFCDHHETARELALYLGRRLRTELPSTRPSPAPWKEAFVKACRFTAEGPAQRRALEGFVEWLSSTGMTAQIGSWLPAVPQSTKELAAMLRRHRPRESAWPADVTASIALELSYLWNKIRQSSSSRQLFARGGEKVSGAIPDTHRIVAVTDPPERLRPQERSLFHPGSPDTVLALFNSPFGPDVLVVTDAFSEGFDLHRYCRHIIHYELDPSPMRTIQRNGRLRRVDCWAARTGRPLEMAYPVFKGTRDQRLVEVMQSRLAQFDLLLGGIGSDIYKEASDLDSRQRQEAVLNSARAQLSRKARRLCVVKG